MFTHYDGRCYSQLEYSQYVYSSGLAIRRVIVHHTAVPTVESWRGEKTMLAMKRVYEERGWTCGPHVFCAPDGIWVMAPLAPHSFNRGAGWESVEDVNVEIVGNYMTTFPIWPTLDNALSCIATLLRQSPWRFGALCKHRDFAVTSCPGDELVRRWDEFALMIIGRR